jgi:hypothetical protein
MRHVDALPLIAAVLLIFGSTLAPAQATAIAQSTYAPPLLDERVWHAAVEFYDDSHRSFSS